MEALKLLLQTLPGWPSNREEAAGYLRIYDQETPLIFVTNLAQYAVKGYEVGALDFIVKPVHYFAFAMRMDRAMRLLRRKAHKVVLVQNPEETRVVALSDILYIDVMDHEVTYHLVQGEALSARGSLSAAESALEGTSIVRISNSCLVNAEKISSFSKDSLRLVDGQELYFSRSRKKAAIAAITDFLGGSL